MNARMLTLLFLATAALRPAAAIASSPGDTYAQVVQENGPAPSVVSGGPVRILVYPKFSIKLRDGVVVSVKAALASPAPGAPPSAATSPTRGDFVPPDPQLSPAAQWNVVNLQRMAALNQVVLIINQEVEGVPVERGMNLGHWENVWFHPGALTPDFAHVDIRTSQEYADYMKHEYVTSNQLHPGIAYRADQVEFNANTKLFYQDRSVPKKRLDEAEMLEVNRLYRVIGKCNAAMQALGQPPAPIQPTA
jgi:hypothetical protein